VARTRGRLIIAATVLWAVSFVLTWMTGTWKDLTDAGRTQVILWNALAQMVFWVGLVCIAWAVGVSVLRYVAEPDRDE
jgi:cation transporter-like permease